jgi:hypothetical protein
MRNKTIFFSLLISCLGIIGEVSWSQLVACSMNLLSGTLALKTFIT